MQDNDLVWKLKQITPGMLSKQQIQQMSARINNFDHVKVADYNFGASFMAKWVISLYNAAVQKGKKATGSMNVSKLTDYSNASVSNSRLSTDQSTRFRSSQRAAINDYSSTKSTPKIKFFVKDRNVRSRQTSRLQDYSTEGTNSN